LCATIKNWVAQFKRGDFSTSDAPRPGRPKTVTTPEIIDQIHELILEDRRISAKSIAEQHSWRYGHAEALCKVGPEMPERGLKTSTLPVVWATFAIFSARSKWFPVRRDWWPWTKPGYITMTRRLKLSFIIYSIKRNRMSFLNTHRLFWLSTILLTNIQIQIQTYTHTHTHGEHTYIHACMQIQGSQLHSNDNIIKQDNLTEDYHITILFV